MSRLASIFLLLLALLSAPFQSAQAEALAIIASPTLEIKADRRTLLDIFLLRQSADQTGHLLTVVSLEPDQPMFESLISQCLHWNPRIIANRWRRNIYTGEGRIPLLINNWGDMRNTLLKTPDAIGYLPVSQVPDQFHILLTCQVHS